MKTICALLVCAMPLVAKAELNLSDYVICVSNEKSGDISVIDGKSLALVDNITVGRRPRGIHAGPEGKYVYVALSGTPISGPPALDKDGKPIFKDDDDKNADHSADGIGVVDLQEKRVVKKLAAGSDPEQFAVSRNGAHIYISNE